MSEPTFFTGTVTCDDCWNTHVAEYSHQCPYSDRPMYAVVCPTDGLTGYYDNTRVIPNERQ
jgi:hypothetical protein